MAEHISDFQKLLQEFLKDPDFRKFWKQYEQLKALALAGEVSWEELDRELDRLCDEEEDA